MSFTKENTTSEKRILLILTAHSCIRRPLPDHEEGAYRIVLPPEETGLGKDIILPLVYESGGWHIGDKPLSESNPYYLYTQEDEKILLLLSPQINRLIPTGKVEVCHKMQINVGCAFKNQIFYSCYSLVEEDHAQILFEDGEYTISNPGHDGLYVNTKAFCGKRRLHIGDCVDLYGLHILVLKNLLVCVSFCGIFRAVGGGILSNSEHAGKKREEEREAIWIERRCEQERALHTGEVEVLLPDQPPSEPEQPLILSLGPTLTMALPMLLMAQLGSRLMEGTGSNFYYMSVVMTVCSAFLALFWGLMNHGYGKATRKRKAREQERQYREYLDGIEKELLMWEKDNREMLEKKYPPLAQVWGGGDGRAAVLWNRYYRQSDFLFLRIGTGQMPFQVKVKLSGPNKRIVQEKLVKKAQELAERFAVLKHAPAVIDLYENRQIAIMGNLYSEEVRTVLLQLLIQIAACHCYTEVKIVCFYHKERIVDQETAACIKWMSHSWSADKKVRFLAGDDKEASRILPVLTRELAKGRQDREKGVQIPWYIVAVLNNDLIQGEILYQYLTDPLEGCPVSTIFAGMEAEELPKSCRYFISPKGDEGEILNLGKDQISRQKINLEGCSSVKAQAYVRRTAGFRVREDAVCTQLPEQVGFLQLYGCTRVEGLESGRRWSLSRTEERLKVPIGQRAGGNVVNLDVHEKFHGPHGLIAGTTGSGKSELLQTYLLSIAVSFSPADINFFMIDYKGGGTGNLLKHLPHCAGVISNLSGKQIKRAMSAITSENKRRQILLGNYQVNHIDAYAKLYREGKTKKPMPHLILVVDEFAELKKEEPEFMQEIISLAQVGRSLGVHLILATQKPAGTVDDKIWSNARFRLCLRVQDRQDSMDMLHNGDAALLTSPGQCYLQIGNHEYYELFQTAYCGGSYVEEGEEKTRAALLQNTGEKRKMPKKRVSETGPSQIQRLVDYISQTAKQLSYQPAQMLWLPELPGRILLSELKDEKAGVREEGPVLILGRCDDPENQCQFTLFHQPAVQGHMAVFGGPATGKSTLLVTLMWQLCAYFTPEEVQIAAVDMGQENFGCFLEMPNCLGVVTKKEDKDIFCHHLEVLFENRKKLLSGKGYRQYNKSEKEPLPYVFLVIDNFGSMKKFLDEEQQEFLIKLASEGLNLGIYLILSASGVGEVGGKLYEKIKTPLAMEVSDRFLYGDIFRQYYIPVLPKENQKGRGLCKAEDRILEFQAALALGEQEEHAHFEKIEEEGRRKAYAAQRQGMSLPPKFEMIPQETDYWTAAKRFDWSRGKIPLGYCLSTGELCAVSPKETVCFLVSGVERTGRSTLLRCLIEGALYQQYQTVVLDTGGRLLDSKERKKVIYLSEAEEMEQLRQEIESRKKENGITCIFISDMGSFSAFVYRSGEEREKRSLFWEKAAMGRISGVFLAAIYHPGRDYEAAGSVFFKEFTAWQQGIHLGGNAAAQRALNFDDLSYTQQNQHEKAGIGYFKAGVEAACRRLLLPDYDRKKG